MADISEALEWQSDCLKWRGRLLRGEKSHWCYDWDGLPVDETCREWPCGCFDSPAPDALAGKGTR